MTQISVVGLGKLGACMAACLASKGFSVIGVDVNPQVVDAVNAGRAPVFEPGLTERMADARDYLRATSCFDDAISNSEATFILVPTPSEDHGGFSLRYVREAICGIARALRHKSGYHLVVLTSTVLPGATQHGVLPVLERESGRRVGQNVGLCYNPEFVALGSAIRDLLNPDFVLVGESDPRAGDLLEKIQRNLCENDPPFARMNFVNAELTKIAVNTYVTTKITFANMLAGICEQLPGGDVDTVTAALGLDSRIGKRYLKGALGYGGPCFPRDNLALAYLARQLGRPAPLAEATDTSNRAIVWQLVERICRHVPPDGTVAVLGLAYKPQTVVVEESQGLQLARGLAERGVRTVVYDPAALANARRELGELVWYADSVKECVQGANVVVVANPEEAFSEIRVEWLAAQPRPVLIDAWRLLRQRFEHSVSLTYLPLGVGKESALPAAPPLEEQEEPAPATATGAGHRAAKHVASASLH